MTRSRAGFGLTLAKSITMAIAVIVFRMLSRALPPP
jgi:hypothetical protein